MGRWPSWNKGWLAGKQRMREIAEVVVTGRFPAALTSFWPSVGLVSNWHGRAWQRVRLAQRSSWFRLAYGTLRGGWMAPASCPVYLHVWFFMRNDIASAMLWSLSATLRIDGDDDGPRHTSPEKGRLAGSLRLAEDTEGSCWCQAQVSPQVAPNRMTAAGGRTRAPAGFVDQA